MARNIKIGCLVVIHKSNIGHFVIEDIVHIAMSLMNIFQNLVFEFFILVNRFDIFTWNWLNTWVMILVDDNF